MTRSAARQYAFSPMLLLCLLLGPAFQASARVAGLPPFTIDTTSNRAKLFERLTKRNLDPSVTPGAMTLYGEKTQSGLFQNFPVLAGRGLEDGMVLSTGDANDIDRDDNRIKTPMDEATVPRAGFQRQEIIDIAKATAKVEGSDEDFGIYDPASFKINFTTTALTKSFSVDFVYGTDEYPEYLVSQFNDVFIIFLDGKNIAFDSDGRAISVGNNFFKVENVKTHTEDGQIVRNDNDTGYINPAIHINGFTPPLRAQSNIKPGNHTLEFVIVDISDAILNSSAFLSNLRFGADTVVPGVIRKSDLIDDQRFTVLETLKPGEEAGVLAALVPKDSLTFSIVSGPPGISVDPATGRLTVSPGASLSPHRGQDMTYVIQARVTGPFGQADSAKVVIHVVPVDPPIIPAPVPMAVSQAVYQDAAGDGRIDRAVIRFPASKGRAPLRVRLRDPFNPSSTVEIAAAGITPLDSMSFQLDFPDRPFPFGTGFEAALLGNILPPDSLYGVAPFLIADGVGPLPVSADAVGPQKAGDKPVLTVTFSEGVTLDLAAKAFPYDIRSAGRDLAGPIAVESIRDLGGNRFLYTFSSPDYPLPGDSLRVQSGTPALADARGNKPLMNYFIPVTGKFPVPPMVLQASLSSLVSTAPILSPVLLSNALLIEAEGRPGLCVGCKEAQAGAALQQMAAAFPAGEAKPQLVVIKTNGPFRYDLNVFTNRGEWVNRARGAVEAADLQALPKDAEGNHVLKLFWWPVSPGGQPVGTGAYIVRGGIQGAGRIDVSRPLQPGFSHLPSRPDNLSVVFGFLRR